MKLIGLNLKLKDGCYDEYKLRHDNLWPEVAQAISSLGIKMAIYRSGNDLFVHAQVPTEKSWEDLGHFPVMTNWNLYMSEVLETDLEGQPIVELLHLAFSYGAF